MKILIKISTNLVDKLSAVWAGFGSGIFATKNGTDELNLDRFRPVPGLNSISAEMRHILNHTEKDLMLKTLFDSGKESVQLPLPRIWSQFFLIFPA